MTNDKSGYRPANRRPLRYPEHMNPGKPRIESPHDAAFGELCDHLRKQSETLDDSGNWPAEQLRKCAEYGVFEWFAGRSWGGQEWHEADLVQGYLALSAACLTTTFILTQRNGACQRIERSDNEELKQRLLPSLIRGDLFATVGISHLTTSRRHLAGPVLRAEESVTGFRLDGFSPWVTGAAAAEIVVVGATLPDERQI